MKMFEKIFFSQNMLQLKKSNLNEKVKRKKFTTLKKFLS